MSVGGTQNVPTALSSMIPCALVFAADIAAGFTLEAKKRRRKEILGELSGGSCKSRKIFRLYLGVSALWRLKICIKSGRGLSSSAYDISNQCQAR